MKPIVALCIASNARMWNFVNTLGYLFSIMLAYTNFTIKRNTVTLQKKYKNVWKIFHKRSPLSEYVVDDFFMLADKKGKILYSIRSTKNSVRNSLEQNHKVLVRCYPFLIFLCT
jgi:hypothetical protein